MALLSVAAVLAHVLGDIVLVGDVLEVVAWTAHLNKPHMTHEAFIHHSFVSVVSHVSL